MMRSWRMIYNRSLVCPFLILGFDSSYCDTARKKRATLGNPTARDSDGFLLDVDVQAIDDNNESSQCSHEDKRGDIDQFFQVPTLKEINSKQKKYRVCKMCL
jgi:hypothetical protein